MPQNNIQNQEWRMTAGSVIHSPDDMEHRWCSVQDTDEHLTR